MLNTRSNFREKSIKNKFEHNCNPWMYFDSIRCINLRERKDRYEQASEVFKKLKIPVEWFLTDRHPNGGMQGCFESHLSCIKQAYESGAENC